MNPLAMLLFIQETLPPPPAPTGSPDINTAQVVGVVIISLGLIMLGALAIRPIVSRKIGPEKSQPSETEQTDVPANHPGSNPYEDGSRSIIPFPKPAAPPPPPGGSGTVAEDPWVWPKTDSSIEDRFKRVIADTGRRRKLGDRQASLAAGMVAPARLRTLQGESVAVAGGRTSTLTLSPIVPLRDRRLGTTAMPKQKTAGVESEFWTSLMPGAETIERPEMADADKTQDKIDAVVARSENDQPLEADPFGHSAIETPGTENAEFAVSENESIGHDWQALVSELKTGGEERLGYNAVSSGSSLSILAVPDLDELIEAESGGSAPNAAEVESVALAAAADTSLPVPDASSGATTLRGIVAESTLGDISKTVRNLVYCANAGKFISGFALYSDPYLFRFMDSTGLDEEAFRARFECIPPRPAQEWERLDQLSDIAVLADGRVEATVSYIDSDGRPTNGMERFRFELSVEHGFWMIDDIQSLG